MKITMCFKRVMLCHGIADAKAQLSDFELGKKLFWFMRYDILKIVNSKFKEVWILLLSECKDFFIIFLHIMICFYLKVQMKSLKDFKCGWIIPFVDIKKGENSQFFGEITIKASPAI